MSIERLPHPWLGAYWAGWALSSVPVAIATVIPGGALYGLLWWALWVVAFLGAEIPAAVIDTGFRDTFSEVVTWGHRKAAKAESVAWDRGWTAVVTALVVIIGFTSALPWAVVGLTVPVPLGVALGVLAGLQWYLVTRWLYDHFVHTRVFG